MNSIVIFGAGNVATHLLKALSKTQDFEVVQVYNHHSSSLEPFKNFVATTTSLSEVVPADIYIVALKDEAIPPLAQKIIDRTALIVHTSGATPMQVFEDFKNYGVLYPLQTFSKKKEMEYANIPMCLEANTRANLLKLEKLASAISQNTYHITSPQRKSLHVAAVFVSNFVNHLYTMGEELCRKNEIPFEILHPLILETAVKITTMSPFDAQTGPAKRKDQEVIQSHLQQLNPEQEKIYILLTQSIQSLHGKEL